MQQAFQATVTDFLTAHPQNSDVAARIESNVDVVVEQIRELVQTQVRDVQSKLCDENRSLRANNTKLMKDGQSLTPLKNELIQLQNKCDRKRTQAQKMEANYLAQLETIRSEHGAEMLSLKTTDGEVVTKLQAEIEQLQQALNAKALPGPIQTQKDDEWVSADCDYASMFGGPPFDGTVEVGVFDAQEEFESAPAQFARIYKCSDHVLISTFYCSFVSFRRSPAYIRDVIAATKACYKPHSPYTTPQKQNAMAFAHFLEKLELHINE